MKLLDLFLFTRRCQSTCVFLVLCILPWFLNTVLGSITGAYSYSTEHDATLSLVSMATDRAQKEG